MADHSNAKGIYRSIYPAIISTCRIVHEEAKTVLYANNEFRFTDFPVYTGDYRVFGEQCDNIFKYNERDWLRSDGFLLLSTAPIVRFLNKIGARNAASLKVVELTVYCRYSSNIALATDLLLRHMPALKILRYLVQGYDLHEYDDRYHLHNREVAIQPFCSTMRDGDFSIEVFDYNDDGFSTIQDLKVRLEYSGNIAPLS